MTGTGTQAPMSARRRTHAQPPVLRMPPPPTADPAPIAPPTLILPTTQADRDACTELVTEQLGWTPMSYVDDIINSMSELLYQGIASFEEWLDDYNLKEDELDKGLAATETLFAGKIDKQFDKFELFVLQSIFSVPVNLPIKLPHYEGLDFSVSSADEEAADAELEKLRKQLVQTTVLQNRLKDQWAAIEIRKCALRKLRQEALDLAAIKSQHDIDLTDTVSSLSTVIRNMHDLKSDLNSRIESPAFALITSQPSPETAEMENMKSAIAAALERAERRRRQQLEAARTPSKRRRSSIGLKVKSAREGAECAADYRDRVEGIGNATATGWIDVWEAEVR
ncbi:hypothetical protein HDU85_003051 [Gaertneriomyces sp. JEL0708]|nr:hypothetical protein HDU85_003051 [Gaertneriomyces sp. JEL0708]